MRKCMRLIKYEIEPLERFVLDQIPRSKNHKVNALTKLASLVDYDVPRTVFREVKPNKSIDEEKFMFLSRVTVWMEPIINLKKTDQLPSDPAEAKYVKARDKRLLNHLKRKVGNKARVEGSICNAYVTEEIANFCSNYFQPGVDTKSRDLGRNVNPDVASTHGLGVPELFREDCGRPGTDGRLRWLQDKEYDRAHLYVLANSGILSDYERRFEDYIVNSRPNIAKDDVWSKCEAEFPSWFKTNVLGAMTSDDVTRALAMGPSRQVRTWNQFFVNGYNFHKQEYGKNKSTMNYGVCVQAADRADYFGILEEVIELMYHDKPTLLSVAIGSSSLPSAYSVC
ncbi:uncharacterized protein LOC130589506 [Beta vulgaris subsp. vulgaris]|uniref:uncharacterized protein LOC130589506 n=1 Tax=Beta vulgaris subsp. vulgaris TaxID=3555 RepID=UPI00254938C2|nr:uncharacterized protein LOC130589506 [Beta vulgaris subsp. vulgaris]